MPENREFVRPLKVLYVNPNAGSRFGMTGSIFIVSQILTCD